MWAVPLGLVAAAAYGGPVWACTTVLGARFGRADPDPRITIPVAGGFFALSLVLLVVHVVRFLGGPRSRSLAAEGFAFSYAALGLLTLLAAARRGMRDDVAHWQLWVVPMAAAAALSVVFLWLLVRAKHRCSPGAEARPDPALPPGRAQAFPPGTTPDRPLVRDRTSRRTP